MGDSSSNEFGFRSRAAALLSKREFSDVEIQVIDGNNRKSFPAHKLFLAISSRHFASLFYDNEQSPSSVKIFDFKPHTVFMMLQFLYTEEVNFECTAEAADLYRLAKKYVVEDLVKVCVTYLMEEKTTIDNIFQIYDFALSENIPRLLKVCRDTVSTQTMEVLKSPHFTETRLPVLEDILQLNDLSIMSELDLIEAAIEWARQESLKSTSESWRICAYPLFKYLRFLSLTATEFCDLVERYQNILSSHESTVITMGILQPGTLVGLPSGFCTNSNPRCKPTSSENKSLIFSKISTVENKISSDAPPTLLKINHRYQKPNVESQMFDLNDHSLFGKSFNQFASATNIKHSIVNTNVENRNYDFDIGIKEHFRDLYEKNNEAKPNYDLASVLIPHKPKSDYQNQHLPSGEVHANAKSKPSVSFQRSVSSKQTPVLKIAPQISLSNRRTFEFPLIDLEKSFSSAFNQDINSSALICVYRGAIEIHGIELKLQQKSLSVEESITAFLTISGSTISTQSMTYEEKLRNSVYSMNFPNPVKLLPRNQVEVLVEIEDVSLNRCFGCNNDKLMLNCGLNTTAEISLKSNQSGNNNRDFFFLISRLIYKPST